MPNAFIVFTGTSFGRFRGPDRGIHCFLRTGPQSSHMSKRLFVSVDLDGLGDAVAAVQDRFDGVSGLRLTDPGQAHVTLKFLGDTAPDRVADVVAALEAAVDDSGVEPFEADIGGLGVFPSLSYISVVWAASATRRCGEDDHPAEAIEDGPSRGVRSGGPRVHAACNHRQNGPRGGKRQYGTSSRTTTTDVERAVTELRLKESGVGLATRRRTVESVSL